MLVQKRRNTTAALRLLRKLLRNHGIHPEMIVTDGLASYRSATRELCCGDRHRRGRMCAQPDVFEDQGWAGRSRATVDHSCSQP